jgi:hypothetical protein
MVDTASTAGALKRAVLTAAGLVVFIAPVAVGARNPPPQTRDVAAPATLPAFEEVSVRPNAASGPGGRGGLAGSQYVYRSARAAGRRRPGLGRC